MNGYVMFSDLDGTLIFSAKHKQDGDIIVERKGGEEISCVTERQAELLPRLKNIIPVTTRSVEQYRRIAFPEGFAPEYALCDNGCTLLINGEKDGAWLESSAAVFNECTDEIERLRGVLEHDPDRRFEVRLVDGFFLFTKSASPALTLARLGAGEKCRCYATGEKVYVVPKALDKGEGVRRLAEMLKLERKKICVAGDSLMDVSMLNLAGIAVFTENIPEDKFSAAEKIRRPAKGFPSSSPKWRRLCKGDETMFNILIVDDQPNIRRLYEYTLEKDGYRTFSAANGEEALSLIGAQHIDLVILDVMMPVLDGYGCLRALRESGSNIPVLIITAKDEPEDVRRSFLLGTDDFMVKPVDDIEMLLRIKALLRRSKISEEQRIVVGGSELVYDSFSVIREGNAVVLPRKEFQILFKLLSFPGKTFTRQNLMDEFWSMDTDSEARTVDVHINRLRERFKDNPDFSIITVRGLGYKAVRND